MRDVSNKQAPIALKVHRSESGEIELIRVSDGGTTFYFDSTEDAIRRLSSWASQGETDLVSPADPMALLEEQRGNRRSESRLRPGDVSWLCGARSMYGAHIRVIDISWNGVLIETEHEFAPGSLIAFELLKKDGPLRVAGRVLRSRRLLGNDIRRFNGDGSVWYEAGCRFSGRLDLESYLHP